VVSRDAVLRAAVESTVSGGPGPIRPPAATGRRRTYTAPVTDLTKAPAEKKPTETPRPPRTINLVVAAVCAQIVFSITRIASMFGYTGELGRLLVDQNNKAKKPVRPYGPSQIADDLHRLRVNSVVQGAVVAAALLVLAFLLRRPGTATMSRWGLLIVMLVTFAPFAVLPGHGLPVVTQVAGVLSGVASIVAIVALFLPGSRAYFKALAAARMAAAGRTAAPARGLGALFGGGAAGARKPPPPSGVRSSAASRANGRLNQGGAAAVRAKTRSDEAAIARGAALARSRAKASKSRRTER
jgi:hypothetical protein